MSRANAKEWFKSISLDTQDVYDTTMLRNKVVYVYNYSMRSTVPLKVIIIYFMNLLRQTKLLTWYEENDGVQPNIRLCIFLCFHPLHPYQRFLYIVVCLCLCPLRLFIL